MAQLAATAKQRNLPNLTVQTVDLERKTEERPEFPKQKYDVIIVFFYLHRALFPSLIDSLKPNGVFALQNLYHRQHLRYHHPRRWEFCLAHNELLRLTFHAPRAVVRRRRARRQLMDPALSSPRDSSPNKQAPAAYLTGDMSRIDLHLHTTHSDGSLSPAEVLGLPTKQGHCAGHHRPRHCVRHSRRHRQPGLSWELKSFPAWKSVPASAIVSSISLAIA